MREVTRTYKSTVGMDKQAWLALRKGTVGSSDIGTILQLNKYETPRELFNKKVGLAPEFEGNDNTEWGTELEDFCALMFERKEMGEGKLAGRVQRDNKIRANTTFPWATCNLDRLIVGGAEPIILELKTAPAITPKHVPQLMKYVRARSSTGMNVTDAAVVCFTERDTVEFHCVRVQARSPYFRVEVGDD